jgi:nucleoside-diphosphate-sugar epimerase
MRKEQEVVAGRRTIADTDELEDRLSEPTEETVQALCAVPGDIVILGVGGKMGPTLARMARRAADRAGGHRRVVGVSRFASDFRLETQLKSWGIDTLRSDLADPRAYAALPDAPNVVYMAGLKFGSSGQEPLLWAMNALVPGRVAERYRDSRIVAFSTGNVYGLSPVKDGGSIESDPVAPVGEYAMSCLGRERIFQHFSRTAGTKVAILRLNYATELRYGVLVDIAHRIVSGEPVSLAMGHLNAIWQADASAIALRSLPYAAQPAFMLNVAGPELLSTRRVAEDLARRLDLPVRFEGEEAPSALLSNAQRSHALFGYPRVSVEQMIAWIADWVRRGGESLGKPTHFEERAGRY